MDLEWMDLDWKMIGIALIIGAVLGYYFRGPIEECSKEDTNEVYDQKKSLLLKNLRENVYCRLKPSPVSGIGVFAIKDIPDGENPFQMAGKNCFSEGIIYVSNDELSGIPDEVQKMMEQFFARRTPQNYFPVLEGGLNAMNISFYMNHSKNPNIKLVSVPGCSYYQFVTQRRITLRFTNIETLI